MLYTRDQGYGRVTRKLKTSSNFSKREIRAHTPVQDIIPLYFLLEAASDSGRMSAGEVHEVVAGGMGMCPRISWHLGMANAPPLVATPVGLHGIVCVVTEHMPGISEVRGEVRVQSPFLYNYSLLACPPPLLWQPLHIS